ncbi:MAG: nicotinate-nucleotide--dimethylbenzimidazole phosphoribosyltransferase [Spirochaetes bacterium GWB1_66_5]|nr:MAG: nicotinate-nucleotide--dimethylbenzimidazole phosphoribosyltransferase [Spirochaetes bacterium GWB1_66_5]
MLEQVLRSIREPDQEARRKARERQNQLTKPPGSLGRLEELSVQLAGIQRTPRPKVGCKAILTMAGDHGVVAEGVSAYPQEVTAQMVRNFLSGGAAVNVLAAHVGARVVVVDLGVAADLSGLAGLPLASAAGTSGPRLLLRKVGPGTRNLARGPAMSREEALRSLEAGIEVLAEEAERGLDIVGLGEMGIGNTTPAAAITAVMTGTPVPQVTGRGTGLDDDGLVRKVQAIEAALAANRPDPRDALGVLAAVGGFEIGGLAGAMLAAAARSIPVVVDGFICASAALIACGLKPGVREYLIASHQSVEVGHLAILRHLRLQPIFNLDLRLGEGTGAALGIGLVEAAARILEEMATFGQAGVSNA